MSERRPFQCLALIFQLFSASLLYPYGYRIDGQIKSISIYNHYSAAVHLNIPYKGYTKFYVSSNLSQRLLLECILYVCVNTISRQANIFIWPQNLCPTIENTHSKKMFPYKTVKQLTSAI